MGGNIDRNSSEGQVDLSGQVAIVTGAARGLGRAYALRLAKEGAKVVIADILDGSETVEAVKKQGGGAIAVKTDVTSQKSTKEMARKAVEAFARIDILVNNAGIGTTYGPVWHVDPAAWWRNMEVNLFGTFLCTWMVLPGMLERQRGCIINVASGTGLAAIPNYSAYTVSKTALIRFSENLAMETKEKGIQVYAISPGMVRTAMTEYSRGEEGQRWLPWTKELFDQDRFVPPERAAELVLRLASGRYEALSGLYLSITDNLQELVERIREVKERELYTLRLRKDG